MGYATVDIGVVVKMNLERMWKEVIMFWLKIEDLNLNSAANSIHPIF
jgi:hypothetical protein